MEKVLLKKGRERPVLNGHPWIFCGAIERLDAEAEKAGVADVVDSEGRRLARGLKSEIPPVRHERLSPGKRRGDFFRGLVIDRYGDFFVCQFMTAGIDRFKWMVTEALSSLFPGKGIYERSEGGVREEEGLSPSVGVLSGEEPPDLIRIEENQLRFLIDVRAGQKTGFFLDQRDNRLLLSSNSPGKTVFNCFAYTGAFSLYAAR